MIPSKRAQPHLVIVVAITAVLSLQSFAIAGSPSWMRAHDKEIALLVSRMTLAEKVGQMTQPDLGSLKDITDIKTLYLGSVLSGGSSDPKSGNSLRDWTETYENCQKLALKTRLAIPLIYGIDSVHGNNNVLGAVIFPHNIGLGCSRNPDIVEQVSKITAAETRATGIQWAFAPCIAVPQDIRWGRTYEGFSEDPQIVTELGLAALRGLQSDDLSNASSVLGCAKHFVGDGGTAYGSSTRDAYLDQGDTRVDEATLRGVHLAGYPALIDAGVGSVMPSYSSWNGVKCSGNPYLLTQVLKRELGFDGFVISDYNAIDHLVPAQPSGAHVTSNNASGQVVTSDYKKCIELSINAGMDMVMVTGKYRDFVRMLQELVQEERVSLERIDDAVTRILRVKFSQGLMKQGANLMANAELQESFGSAAHRAVAREAVRQSVVILKNEGASLPLSRLLKRIHVTGRGADNLGMQCGGWTIDWQGKMGDVTPGGTTLLQGLRDSFGLSVITTDSETYPSAKGADVVVVVVGEEPYAEMKGDRASLALAPEDLTSLSAARSAGIPVVLVVLSGRPLILGVAANQADAIVAAWLPGTEGQGVIDVLSGDAKPTGRLSFTWPMSMDQIPRGRDPVGDDKPLFPLGFGLQY
jgi:beta-glucosidase